MRRPISRRSAAWNCPTAPWRSSAAASAIRPVIDSGGRLGEPALELGDPCLQSCHALSELAHVISAVLRCSGKGRGPKRGGSGGIGVTLGGLYCRRNLGVRGCKQAGDLLGQGPVGGQAGELALAKIEPTAGRPG